MAKISMTLNQTKLRVSVIKMRTSTCGKSCFILSACTSKFLALSFENVNKGEHSAAPLSVLPILQISKKDFH